MKKYDVMIAAAGILWGLLSLFFTYLNRLGLNARQAVAVRLCFAAIIMVLYLAVCNPKALRIKRPAHCLYFVGTGIVSLAFFNACYFAAIGLAGASVAALLLYTAPAFVMLLSAALFREKLTGRKLGCLFLTAAGCVCVTGVLSGVGAVAPRAVLFGLGAGFGYALYSIFGKYALRQYSSQTITAYTFVFGALGLLPLSAPGEIIRAIGAPLPLLAAAGSALCCTVVPYLLYTRGLGGVESGRAAIIATVEPAVAALVGILILHEGITIRKIMGILLILGAVILMNLGGTEKKYEIPIAKL